MNGLKECFDEGAKTSVRKMSTRDDLRIAIIFKLKEIFFKQR